jgi:acetyl esterase
MVPPNTRKKIYVVLIAVLAFIVIIAVYFKVSPAPASWLLRLVFDREAVKVNEALEKHLPVNINIVSKLNLPANESDNDQRFDLFYPSTDGADRTKLPLIIWIHGGGYVSGDKAHIRNYCKILAAKGYAVAAVNYSVAPGKTYPTQVFQILAQIDQLISDNPEFPIDTGKVFLAGDSAGAHCAAQIAALVTNSSYADKLKISTRLKPSSLAGLLLFCGPYNVRDVSLDGKEGTFFQTVLWAYSGTKNFKENDFFMSSHVLDYVNQNFPPVFITVGNGDFLRNHSFELTEKLQEVTVEVDTLFFPDNYEPKLPHEYQFNLDIEAGKLALTRALNFLAKHS